ncbi:MAG TPA: hypothetical protein DDY14_08175 [Chromatiaceae bacterium]|nr:MAG: hypothetical protein N838_04230 [Thiohalocapsa sp. PB-PSB1]HBG95287.1 hypothetical protein [Chromatiaceae bacterium]HCS88613.1 hypothetical protein [Chromatiaceae bacterium]
MDVWSELLLIELRESAYGTASVRIIAGRDLEQYCALAIGDRRVLERLYACWALFITPTK